MDNILFFLTPKAMCSHLMADDTLRQALVRMESAHYAALPILEEFDYKAVVALITSCMETSDGAFWMDWQMCRQAAQGGTLELGVHTHATHKYPGIQRREGESREEYRARLSADLDTAIALIQEKAGMTPIYFAYPQGIKDEWATDLIDGRFQVTGTSFIGVNDPDNGTHDLRR